MNTVMTASLASCANNGTLSEQYHQMARESNFVSDLTHRLQSFLGTARDDVTKTLNGLVEGYRQDNLDVRKLTSKESKVLNRIKDINYGVFSERFISVPEGFVGQFVPYIDTLISILEQLPKLNKEMLDNYIVALSAFISSHDDNLPMRDYTKLYKEAKLQRHVMRDKIGVFFNDTDNTRIAVSNVIDRMSDVEQIVRKTQQLGKVLRHLDLKELKGKVDKIVSYLDVLIKKIQTEELKVSTNTSMTLSEGAFEVSKYVEALAVLYYDVQVLLNKVDEFYDVILKA